MIALLNLSVLGFSFVVFPYKAKRTQQGNLLVLMMILSFFVFLDNKGVVHSEKQLATVNVKACGTSHFVSFSKMM